MSYRKTRNGREVMYEKVGGDRIDMYLYFNTKADKINGAQGVQPEDVVVEVSKYVEYKMGTEQLPTQQAKLLEEAVARLSEAFNCLSLAADHEAKKGGRTRGV